MNWVPSTQTCLDFVYNEVTCNDNDSDGCEDNVEDLDDDNDTCEDGEDDQSFIYNESDLDDDNIINDCDRDDDGDGICDFLISDGECVVISTDVCYQGEVNWTASACDDYVFVEGLDGNIYFDYYEACEETDNDFDGCLDAIEDNDVDNDTIEDSSDNCYEISNMSQEDEDDDGIGDLCDDDIDDDGVTNVTDPAPYNSAILNNKNKNWVFLKL